MFDIITIGDATVDTFIIIDDKSKQTQVDLKKKLLSFNYADKICINNIDQSLGGNAANISVAMKRLGYKSAIITELGDDINGITVHHELEKHGVDTSLVRVLKNKQTRFSVVLNYQAERTILSYHAKRQYKAPVIPQTKWVYFSSLGKGFEKVQQRVLSHKKKHPEMMLAFNPGSYQLNNALPTIRKVLPYCDVLFVNKEEAQLMAGKKGTIKQSFSRLHKAGVPLVVITDGTKGSYASDGNQQLHMGIYPVPPVAKTGAGDAYASGFMAALLAKKDVATAMQWGTANACGVTQKVGAQHGLLTARGVQRFVKKFAKHSTKKY